MRTSKPHYIINRPLCTVSRQLLLPDCVAVASVARLVFVVDCVAESSLHGARCSTFPRLFPTSPVGAHRVCQHLMRVAFFWCWLRWIHWKRNPQCLRACELQMWCRTKCGSAYTSMRVGLCSGDIYVWVFRIAGACGAQTIAFRQGYQSLYEDIIHGPYL